MTLGEKIKSLRQMHGMTQEGLAEKINVSRSAIAKWENNNGVPEIGNLKVISEIFSMSLDEMLDEEASIHAAENTRKVEKYQMLPSGYAGWYCSVDLVGWNDGEHNVLILGEDEDFLFYQKAEKKNTVFGILGKKYISAVEKKKPCDTMTDCSNLDRNYFVGKNVSIEIACKSGFFSGFFDFTSDDYRNVMISAFEEENIVLELGRKIEVNSITKIENIPVYFP